MHERRRQDTPEQAAAGRPRAPQTVPGLPSAIGNRAMARLAHDLQKPPGSRALALRTALRTPAPRSIARDLTKTHYVWKGKFQMNMKTQSNPGGNSGLSGTITFTPDKTGGDTTKLRLYQAVRLEDTTTGKDYQWTGADKPRSDMQTTADAKKHIDPGWWIDINPALTAKRTKKADAVASPYYRDYWPNAANSQDGSKKGNHVVSASLWDFPSWNQNSRYSFETVAKAGRKPGRLSRPHAKRRGAVAWAVARDGRRGHVHPSVGLAAEDTASPVRRGCWRRQRRYRSDRLRHRPDPRIAGLEGSISTGSPRRTGWPISPREM